MNVSKSRAAALYQTEYTHIMVDARLQSLKDAGFEEYEIDENMDSDICSECASMHGKHFKLSEYQQGITAPPFHTRCRGTITAYFAEDDHPQMEKYVVKPIFSREGANVSIIENGKTIEAAEGPYGEEGMIVQQFHPLPKFGDSYMLIGSWLVNDQPAGIGIREDRALITQDMSRFYPHICVE